MISVSDYKKRLEQSFDMFKGGIKRYKTLEFGDPIPVKEWVELARNGSFIDYDGHGNFATQLKDSEWIVGTPNVYPSDIKIYDLIPPDFATHVIWYNK